MEAGQGRRKEGSDLVALSRIWMNPECGSVKIFVAIC